MIAQLSNLSSTARPTAFHQFVKLLDDRGQLLRLYTQNIDNLEEKTGLTSGVPHWGMQKRICRSPNRTPKKQSSPTTSLLPSPAPSSHSESLSDSGTVVDESSASTPAPGPAEHHSVIPPRCIPLHGTLKYLTCRRCSHQMALQEHVDVLSQGASVACPQCAVLNSVRRMVGKRERGIGVMRPSVVLYGEVHQDGEGVGECVRRDLLGLGDVIPTHSRKQTQGEPQKPVKISAPRAKNSAKPDLLIVAGSSLKVPGTRRIVREFAKAVQANRSPWPKQSDKTFADSSKISSSSTRPSRARAARASFKDAAQHPATIYLNFDFPVPAREWEGVFDVWLQGDVQSVISDFVEALYGCNAEKPRGATRNRETTHDFAPKSPKKPRLETKDVPVAPKKPLLSRIRKLPETVKSKSQKCPSKRTPPSRARMRSTPSSPTPQPPLSPESRRWPSYSPSKVSQMGDLSGYACSSPTITRHPPWPTFGQFMPAPLFTYSASSPSIKPKLIPQVIIPQLPKPVLGPWLSPPHPPQIRLDPMPVPIIMPLSQATITPPASPTPPPIFHTVRSARPQYSNDVLDEVEGLVGPSPSESNYYVPSAPTAMPQLPTLPLVVPERLRSILGSHSSSNTGRENPITFGCPYADGQYQDNLQDIAQDTLYHSTSRFATSGLRNG